MTSRQTRSEAGARQNRRVALVFACVAAGMLGMAYAAVPLYRIFCEVTGFDGTPRRATQASTKMLDRTITVRFDANINDLPWTFEPVHRTMQVRIGENALAFYRATNTSDRTVSGQATFNVTPEVTGSFFNKIACFCFTEQSLEPGQSVDMPVSFFVDPAIVDDKDARKVSVITLSYTFYPFVKPLSQAKAPAAPSAGDGAAGPVGKGG